MKLRIESTLKTSLILAGMLVCAVAAGTLAGSLEWSNVANDVEQSHDLISDLDRTLTTITDAETGQQGYVLTKEKEYLSAYESGSSESRRLLAKLNARTGQFPALKSGLAELSPLIEEKLAELSQTVSLMRTQGFRPTKTVILEGRGRRAMDGIRARIATMRVTQEKLLSTRQSHLRDIRVWTANGSIAGSLLALLILGLSGSYANHSAAAARHAQQKLDAFMEHNPSVVFIKNASGQLIYCNPAFERMFKLQPKDWRNKFDADIWPKEVAEKLRQVDLAVQAGNCLVEATEHIPLPTGEVRDFLSIKFPFRQEGQLYVGGIAFDITQRRIELAALKTSEEFNRSILESTRDCILVLNLEGRILSVNEAGKLLLQAAGVRHHSLKDWTLFWEAGQREGAIQAIAAACSGETARFEAAFQTLEAPRPWFDAVVSPIRGDAGEVSKLLVVSREITDKKLAEEHLRNSEMQYRNLFDLNPLPAWIYDQETFQILDVNRIAIDRYGYTFEEFLRLKVTDIRVPEEHGRIEQSLTVASLLHEWSGPWHHRMQNGQSRSVELAAQRIQWLGRPARLIMVHDISDHVASEEKFRRLFECSGDAILLSFEGIVVDCNPAAVSMLGARTKDRILGLTPSHLLAERQPDGTGGKELADAMREESSRHGSLRRDLMHRRMNGEEFLVDLSMTMVNIHGKEMRLVIWHDLTERMVAQTALRKSESQLRESQRIAGLGSFDLNVATECVEWSEETFKLFGFQPGLVSPSIGEIYQRIHPEDRDRVVAHRRDTIGRKLEYNIDYRVVWPSGEIRHVQSRGQWHFNPQGTAVRLTGTTLDTTEQRRVHEALTASEAIFQAFMQNSPALAYIKDREGRMVYMNRICQTMWNLDRVEWQGKTDAELWSPSMAAEFRVLDLSVLDSGIAGSNIDTVPLPGGGECNLLTYKFPLSIAGGEPLLGGISLDISEQKEAERNTLAALADKEVLLQEVHHRVKNNLQIICSLLGMKAASSQDAQTIMALRESQDRVQSMAMIHELLYGSKTLDGINFFEYSERLVIELAASYGLGNRVRLRTKVAPICLSIGQAIPCGLILNELVSNALKYAFPGGREGEVVVSLEACGKGLAKLAVRDNGIGLSGDFRVEGAASLGLRIVQILAKQLEGELSLEPAQGGSFSVLFPLDVARKEAA